jgi:hypothetical protein
LIPCEGRGLDMNLSPVERILSNISELIIYRNRLEGIIRRDGEEEEEEEEESVIIVSCV